MRYVMFLRGINVGGIKVPMAELRTCLTELGLQDVTTLLQTGNVRFESGRPITELKAQIEAALTKRFGYHAMVLIYSADTLGAIIAHYPFPNDDGRHSYVVFCLNEETVRSVMDHEAELDPRVEKIAAGKQVVYWTVPVGSTLDTTFAKILARPTYRTSTTNRNLKTLAKVDTP